MNRPTVAAQPGDSLEALVRDLPPDGLLCIGGGVWDVPNTLTIRKGQALSAFGAVFAGEANPKIQIEQADPDTGLIYCTLWNSKESVPQKILDEHTQRVTDWLERA